MPHDCDRARHLAYRVLVHTDSPRLDYLLRLYLDAHLDCKED